VPVDDVRRLAFIREETRFEIGLLHDRINALISAEAFLTIAFTMAMSNSNAHWGTTFTILVPPILSVVGLILAGLAWPGVDASFKIILEWNARQVHLMQENAHLTDVMWRLDVLGRGNHRADPDQRNTMLFARAVPAVFGIAWAVLTVVALVLPFR
jgi:hypothetical protein